MKIIVTGYCKLSVTKVLCKCFRYFLTCLWIRGLHFVYKEIKWFPHQHVLEQGWNSMYWNRAETACTGTGLKQHVLGQGWNSVYWDWAETACIGTGLKQHVLGQGWNSMYWDRAETACTGTGLKQHVLGQGW
jgi:hypothetical protein